MRPYCRDARPVRPIPAKPLANPMLQFITNSPTVEGTVAQARQAIEGGCKWVQIRMKDAPDSDVEAAARQLIPLCKDQGVILVIDDRVGVVMETRVHGVHLGPDDMPPAQAREVLGPHAIIGCTAHNADDIRRLSSLDIDYIGLGPYRHTTTKSKLAPLLGSEGLSQVMAEVRAAGIETPVVAIGGLTADDVTEVLRCGASGIAISGDIISAPDPVEQTRKILGFCNL